jgi:integrase
MARSLNKLTALKIKSVSVGCHNDGGGLYLQKSSDTAQSWIFSYRFNGRYREMGLGSLTALSLADARERAALCRKMLADRIDPIAARNAEQARVRVTAARSVAFEDCAKAYVETHKDTWKGDKHKKQWLSFFEIYVYPRIGKLPVKDIDSDMVLQVLEPIWRTKTPTAKKLRGRIEKVLDWAKARRYRDGENPARWRGLLDQILPKPSKISKVKHYNALPYDDMGDFMITLRQQPGLDARMLEFTILTGVRSNEAMKAKWEEIDVANKIWIIPAERMKGGREHRVPLSDVAIKVLWANEVSGGNVDYFKKKEGWLFPGRKKGQPMSSMTMNMLLRRMGRTDITVHGFRSTFRDWAAERTHFPREVAEMALAHGNNNKVEAAYQRGDLLGKRRQLMDAWARYCSKPSVQLEQATNIIDIRKVFA